MISIFQVVSINVRDVITARNTPHSRSIQLI